MRPILFDKTATTFITNGIGRLDPVSCVVTEERNGQYELEMVVSLESEYADQIEMNSIIVVKPAVNTSQQAFRVYDIEKPINGKFTVHANHLSYQLNYVTVMPFSVTASSSACATTLAQLKANAVDTGANQFNFSTDVDTIASYAQAIPQVLRKCLGGMRGSVLDQFGGEYEWDNYNVILHETRGVQTPSVTLRYGKNITDISQEENIANTITGIVPYWVDAQGGELVTLSEKVVDSPYASQYPFKRTIPMDFSSDFEEKPTQAQLRAHAQAYVARAGIGVPKVNIKVSFVDLSQTEEYKDLLALQSVKLCDVIGVHFDTLGIDTTAKIVKVKYDCLKERYENIEIGSVKTDLSTTINDTNGAVTALANDTKVNFAKVTNEVQEDIDNATAWLTSSGGYVVAVKNQDGSWKELLFLDTNDTLTARNVLRINENGIGFSSQGVGGPYTQAWTLDGKLVIGGTNVPSITVYNSNSDIIFKADATAMIWNATNSSMDADGVITLNGAKFTSGSITQSINNSYYFKISGGTIGIFKKSDDSLFGSLQFDTYTSSGTQINTAKLQGGNVWLDSDNYLYVDSKVTEINADNDLSLFSKVSSASVQNHVIMDNNGVSIRSIKGIELVTPDSGSYDCSLYAARDVLLYARNRDVYISANRYITLDAANNRIDLLCNRLTINGVNGSNGSYINNMYSDRIYYVDNLSVGYDTVYDVTTDLDIRSDSQGNISWSYNNVTLSFADSVSWDDCWMDVYTSFGTGSFSEGIAI